ncbi:hypothetical protein ABPG74_008149 [Tetrahymena malaccensis]
MHLAETHCKTQELDTNQDIFCESQIIHEPEYFLNLTSNSQEKQFQVDNQQILQVAYQKQKIQSSSVQRHELNLKKEIQQHNSLDVLKDINNFDNKFYFDYSQQDNSQMNSSVLEDKFYESKYVGCFVPNLEQQSTNITFTFNEIEEQSSVFQNQEKKYKNQNILKDIFNSFHKYVKDLKSFPVFDIQNIDLKDVKKKFNRFVKIHSFNNTIIKYVLTHKFYKILFIEYFEKGHLDNWITKSRVSNKDGLKYWASYLIECTKSPSLLENLVTNPTQKKKNKNISN